MKYLLDTNICVFVIRQKSPLVLQRLRRHQTGDVGISTVTLAELRYGADKSNDPTKNHAALGAFRRLHAPYSNCKVPDADWFDEGDRLKLGSVIDCAI